MAGQANVYVVENDKAKQQEIESLLTQTGYAVRSYSTAEDLLENTDLKATGCILADAEIPMSGVGLLNHLREINSALQLVITSENANVPMVVEAFDNGVSSFVEKPFKPDVLFESIDRAIALSQQTLKLETERSDLLDRSKLLTTREKEILCMIVEGLSTKQVAKELDISSRTVESHRANMMKKLDLSKLADMVSFAIKSKLCDD